MSYGANPAGPVFAERLLQVIEGGRRTATYKLAVLLAILDLCAKKSDPDGRPPPLLYTRDIAEEVAALYWPQVIPFIDGGLGAIDLRQISNKRATIVDAVRDLRARAEAVGIASLYLARSSLRQNYERTIDRIEKVVAEQPLPRLQSVGSTPEQFPFIYEIDWVAEETFIRTGPRGRPILMLPGAGDELIRLAPLIRPFAEMQWTRMVANFNGVAKSEQNLHDHLFGSERLVPPLGLRQGLANIQGGRCFYCGHRLPPKFDVDHFLPRVRSNLDSIENLVLADGRCNNDKREVLPGLPFVESWTKRNMDFAPSLAQIADDSKWQSDPIGTRSVARSVYGHLPPDITPFWFGVKNVKSGQPSAVMGALEIWIDGL